MKQLTFKIEINKDDSKVYEIYIGRDLNLEKEIEFIKLLKDVQIFEQENFIKVVLEKSDLVYTLLYTLIDDIYRMNENEIDWLLDAKNNPLRRPTLGAEKNILKVQMPSIWNEKETEEIKKQQLIKS